MGWETLGEVWDGLGRCGTGRGTLREVRTGQWIIGEVWDGSGDPQGGPGLVK